jgi:hypothetical protein
MNNAKIVKDRIANAFASSMGDPDVAREIAFHMTDWDHDIDDLNKLYGQIQTLTDQEILSIVIRFLAHVPNHVAAAKKLAGIGPIEDIFKVGVFEED